jgi:hypothetical protein
MPIPQSEPTTASMSFRTNDLSHVTRLWPSPVPCPAMGLTMPAARGLASHLHEVAGREQPLLLAAQRSSFRWGYLLSVIGSGHQIDSICHMLSDRKVAVPPSAKSWTRSLAALGKTWSVITRWF